MTPLAFAVRRHDPELVVPAAPTPRETKRLSDIDDQDTLRGHVPLVFFYRGGRRRDDDPAAVIRRALGEALVPYYPLAGRLREVAGRKLVVDCTGDGVVFVEADADVRLAELEADGLMPSFSWMYQLLCDVEGSSCVLTSPLLFFQVTRLLCGGFVLALSLNHTICDPIGFGHFLSVVAELACSLRLTAPTVVPPWSRELLEARIPLKPEFAHREFDAMLVPTPPPPPPPRGDLVTRTFIFAPRDVAAIKKRLPPRLLGTAMTFEELTAVLWSARTAALALPPDEEVRLAILVNFRGAGASRRLLRERGLALGGGDHRRGAAGPLAGRRGGDVAGGEGGRDYPVRAVNGRPSCAAWAAVHGSGEPLRRVGQPARGVPSRGLGVGRAGVRRRVDRVVRGRLSRRRQERQRGGCGGRADHAAEAGHGSFCDGDDAVRVARWAGSSG